MDDIRVSIKDVNRNIIELEHLAADEAHKMLRVWFAPDGNDEKQASEMRKAIAEWA